MRSSGVRCYWPSGKRQSSKPIASCTICAHVTDCIILQYLAYFEFFLAYMSRKISLEQLYEYLIIIYVVLYIWLGEHEDKKLDPLLISPPAVWFVLTKWESVINILQDAPVAHWWSTGISARGPGSNPGGGTDLRPFPPCFFTPHVQICVLGQVS